MSEPTIAMARKCVEHLIALHGKEDDSIIEGAKKAARIVAWFERRHELVRAIAKLDEDAPELAALLLDMPMPIADVRRIGL